MYYDDFFSKKTCDRCGGSLAAGRMMSMFNTDTLCMDCIRKERQNPKYREAQEAEHQAVEKGDYNYPGIGYPNNTQN